MLFLHHKEGKNEAIKIVIKTLLNVKGNAEYIYVIL